MSKSLGNYVGLTDPPDEMYGKLMSIPDGLMDQYFRLCTDVPEAEVEEMGRGMASGGLNPRDAKMRLAREIVTTYHSAQAAADAEAAFKRMFSESGREVDRETLLEAAEEAVLSAGLEGTEVWMSRALVLAGLAPSASEARRQVEQGGVWVEDRKVSDPQEAITLRDGLLLRVGKRRVRVVRFSGG
jgi:tyrosyl-tRNA synthetase